MIYYWLATEQERKDRQERKETYSPSALCGLRGLFPTCATACYPSPNRYLILLIPSRRIFDSSVEAAMPSRSAAPHRPETRPRVSRKASSIARRSCPSNVASQPESGRAVEEPSSNTSAGMCSDAPSQRIALCSMTL